MSHTDILVAAELRGSPVGKKQGESVQLRGHTRFKFEVVKIYTYLIYFNIHLFNLGYLLHLM